MQPNNIEKYLDFKKDIFDIKSEVLPCSISPNPEDLHRASLMFENASEPILITEGTFHNIYQFNSSTDKYILRIFKKNDIPAYHFHIEEWASKIAKDQKIPVIEPVFTDTSRYTVDFDYQIIPYSEYNQLGDNSIKNDLSTIALYLTKLHYISLNNYGPLDPRPLFYRNPTYPKGIFDTWGDFLNKKSEDHIEKCLEIGVIDEDESLTILRCIREMCQIDDFIPVLLHGDLGKHNILSDKKDYIFIDWESAMAGDPVYELASLAAFYMPEHFHIIFNTYYKNINRPNNFERKFWLYYLRIVLARTVHRYNFGKKNNPLYPPASERIQLALNNL